MLIPPLILKHELLLRKFGLSPVTNHWGAKITSMPEYIDHAHFLAILIHIEKSITQTHETWKARKIVNSLITRRAIVHFSDLGDRAKRIIRANFVLDEKLVEMIQKVIPDFPKDFFNS
jgi:thioredoxin-related protein